MSNNFANASFFGTHLEVNITDNDFSTALTAIDNSINKESNVAIRAINVKYVNLI